MEYCWYNRGGHNGNCNAWEEEWPTFNYPPPPDTAFHALRLPDPHLTSLKLGKRHYFEDSTPPPPEPTSIPKKGKSYAADVVPRCQVEGCAAPLVNAKEYHRRHKVCQIHAKAPKVVVQGIDQRFCQQCSRFHGVSEFDEAKRSCRRRLAGHNERRRKSSQEQNALARRHSHDMKMMGVGRHLERGLVNNSECALSLLSSNPWNVSNSSSSSSSSPDLPARCSAALRELIAENRASILACRQIEDYKLGSIRAGQGSGGAHVTLNLMQAPNSAFGLLSMHDHNHNKSSKDADHQHCSDLWKLPLGY